jgi:putative MATE family efflux protein
MPSKNLSLAISWQRLVVYYSDKEYFQRLFKIAIPISLQFLLTSSLNLISVTLIGQLGESAVAAVGLANQIFFLLNLLLFGISSGSAIFTAQLWGKRDILNIRRVLGLSLTLGITASLFFFIISQFAPEWALSIYSQDQQVIELGAQYLQIIGWSFIFFAVTLAYASSLRSVGEVRLPLIVTVTALSLNTLLGYVFIFGKLGLPELGVAGAGWAALIARIFECLALLVLVYRLNKPPAAKISELLSYKLPFALTYIRQVLPVVINEILWSLAITTYYVIYGRMGTDAVAAINIASTIDQLFFVIFIGIGNACAVLVGNLIGAGDLESADRYAGRSLSLGILAGLIMGAVIWLASPMILTLYKVSPEVLASAQAILAVIACMLWLRGSNLILFIGVLRSGGDTRYALILDGVIIWVVGVPMAYISAFVLDLPIYLVYLFVLSEEFLKYTLGIIRYFSKKWIHNVTSLAES